MTKEHYKVLEKINHCMPLAYLFTEAMLESKNILIIIDLDEHKFCPVTTGDQDPILIKPYDKWMKKNGVYTLFKNTIVATTIPENSGKNAHIIKQLIQSILELLGFTGTTKLPTSEPLRHLTGANLLPPATPQTANPDSKTQTHPCKKIKKTP
jgi:hypothetical protein